MKVKGKIVEASYNVHGTRSVQRLIQVCKEPDMVKMIMDALRGHIAVLSSDSNGNHVIQRCLQYMPEQYRIDVFREVVNSCVDVRLARLAHALDLHAPPRLLRRAALSGLRARRVPQPAPGRHREELLRADLQPLRQLRDPGGRAGAG